MPFGSRPWGDSKIDLVVPVVVLTTWQGEAIGWISQYKRRYSRVYIFSVDRAPGIFSTLCCFQEMCLWN
jgi:hypothetical protein